MAGFNGGLRGRVAPCCGYDAVDFCHQTFDLRHETGEEAGDDGVESGVGAGAVHPDVAIQGTGDYRRKAPRVQDGVVPSLTRSRRRPGRLSLA